MPVIMENVSLSAPHPAPVRALSPGAALGWMARGWRDFLASPGLSAMHGAAFLLGGLAIGVIGHGRQSLLAGAFSGFLLVAPLLSAGLYALSRQREAGLAPSVATVVAAWRGARANLWRLGLLLAVLGSLWVALSALIVVGWAGVRGGGVLPFLRDFVLAPDWRPFAVWLFAGGLFAALVFAIGAVSVPMLLDRQVGVRFALLTSARAVGSNPAAMLLWAAIVMVTVLVSLALVLPMLVLIPVLGHATWHAYRDSVEAGDLPARV